MASSKFPLDWLSVPEQLIELQKRFPNLHCNLRIDQRTKTEVENDDEKYTDGFTIQKGLREFLHTIKEKETRLAIFFQGYRKENGTGTMIVDATVRLMSSNYFRIDFVRDPFIEQIHGCPNFWAAFILALCPVNDTFQIGAANDTNAQRFTELVTLAHLKICV